MNNAEPIFVHIIDEENFVDVVIDPIYFIRAGFPLEDYQKYVLPLPDDLNQNYAVFLKRYSGHIEAHIATKIGNITTSRETRVLEGLPSSFRVKREGGKRLLYFRYPDGHESYIGRIPLPHYESWHNMLGTEK